MVEPGLIVCGMYAFSERLRRAWRGLFENFELRDAGGNPLSVDLGFGLLDSASRDTLLCGHTCGYPLLKTLAREFSAFCVPVFDVEGADGKLYSSRMIVPAGSGINSLGDCAGKVAAINGYDSNSGMNLLRYELARAGATPGFFREVRVTGDHRSSLEAVATNQASWLQSIASLSS